MEKSVPDREEKRGLQDFKSTEGLKSGFKDIVLAFKSLGKLKHASFVKKRGFQSCGKLNDVSFDKKLQSRRIEIAPGFQPCGKLKDVIFDKKLKSPEIKIVRGFQPCGKGKDVSFDQKRESRRRNEIVGGGGKLKDASFDEKRLMEDAKESWRREIVSKPKYRISSSVIDEEEYQESWNKMRKSIDGSETSFDKKCDSRSQIDEDEYHKESKSRLSQIDECETSLDQKRDSRSQIDEGEYHKESCKSWRSYIDEEEWNKDEEEWKKARKSWGRNVDGKGDAYYIDEEEYCKNWRSYIDDEEWKKDEEEWKKARKSWGSDVDGKGDDYYIDEEEYHHKESSKNWRSYIDEEEWKKARKSWGSDVDGKGDDYYIDDEGSDIDGKGDDYYIDDEEASQEAVAAEPTGRIPISRVPTWYRGGGGIIEVNHDIGRDFKQWHFCVRWGVDGCPPHEQMILIYLKWIAKVLGSKEQALKSLLSVTDTYFICKLSRERAYWFMGFDEVFALFDAIYVIDVHGNIIVGEYAREGMQFSDEDGFYRRKLDEELPEDPVAIPPSKIHERLSRIYAGVPE